MKYLKYLFGVQLLLGSIWCFHYLIYWAAFALLIWASVILMPGIFSTLKQKIGVGYAIALPCIVFAFIFGFYGLKFMQNYFAPVKITHTVNNSVKNLDLFEKQLSKASGACFYAYNNAFSKSLKYKEDQCTQLQTSFSKCRLAQVELANINIPVGLKKEVFELLKETKNDAINSAKNWESFYSSYNANCTSEDGKLDATGIKLQMVSAIKNMYLADIKLKKARSIMEN